ncbi:MAG: hypothetical protein JNL38_27095 [Myxococcales bacterium]|jgi:hypothetical protein|nr:hypothetical protein [Myxococcales bacterium]
MDPTLRTALIAAALVAGVGLLRPRGPAIVEERGVHPSRFWAEKARARGRFDVVLAGDSRVFRGLSPGAMSALAPAGRVHNFGFSSACACGPYLTFVADRVDPASARPTLVIGVTPHSLTPHAERDNGYLAEARRTPSEVAERIYLAPALGFVEPIAPSELTGALLGRPAMRSRYLQRYEADGWVASALEPAEPDRALGEYRRVLSTSKVERRLVEELGGVVAELRARGVRVVAFRPPASAAMRALEAELAGFDEAFVRASLTAAGADYVDVDPDAYATYDGSHLGEEAAVRLSRDLARAIAR